MQILPQLADVGDIIDSIESQLSWLVDGGADERPSGAVSSLRIVSNRLRAAVKTYREGAPSGSLDLIDEDLATLDDVDKLVGRQVQVGFYGWRYNNDPLEWGPKGVLGRDGQWLTIDDERVAVFGDNGRRGTPYIRVRFAAEWKLEAERLRAILADVRRALGDAAEGEDGALPEAVSMLRASVDAPQVLMPSSGGWDIKYEGPAKGLIVHMADGTSVEARPGDTFRVAKGGDALLEPSDGAALITAERIRQQGMWDGEHDDSEHRSGRLAVVAAELALHGTDERIESPDDGFDDYYTKHLKDAFGLVAKHGGAEVRRLTIAGALIAAEIDRVLRRDGCDEGAATPPRKRPPNHDPRAVAKGTFPVHNGPAGAVYADGEVIPENHGSRILRLASYEKVIPVEIEDSIQLLAARYPVTAEKVLEVIEEHGLADAQAQIEASLRVEA
jgi:hypothetical protein